MISMMMFFMSLFVGKQIQQPQIDAMHHDVQTVSALADGMVYYQSQAIQKCWKDGASSCAAGSVDLANRMGSQTASGYGSGYQTVTDGSTYIATTLDTQGAVAGRTHQASTVNSGVFAALKGLTSQSSTVGYYDQAAGGVILPDKKGSFAGGGEILR